jgi:hypothetical protein
LRVELLITKRAFDSEMTAAAHDPETMQLSALHGAKPMRTLERCACATLRDQFGALLLGQAEVDVVACSELR